MREAGWCAVWVVAVSLGAAACGGGPKPPMVPDAPPDPTLMVDASADMPAQPAAPAPPSAPTLKH